ncbi:hypothetical protein SE17_42825, partial [Kouleothrix aurantiaca]
MKKFISQFLEIAHLKIPLPIKWLARGAISGTEAGFILSLMYSMLFILPYSFFIFLLTISDDQSKGIDVLGEGISVVFTTISPVFPQFIFPSAAISLLSGAVTGIGIYFTTKFTIVSSFHAILFSVVFWTPITYFISTQVLPKNVRMWQTMNDFQLYIFLFIPSILFVYAMAYAANSS